MLLELFKFEFQCVFNGVIAFDCLLLKSPKDIYNNQVIKIIDYENVAKPEGEKQHSGE
jgi:hypothetical protein